MRAVSLRPRALLLVAALVAAAVTAFGVLTHLADGRSARRCRRSS